MADAGLAVSAELIPWTPELFLSLGFNLRFLGWPVWCVLVVLFLLI